jgi:hypothetical protein
MPAGVLFNFIQQINNVAFSLELSFNLNLCGLTFVFLLGHQP